MNKLVFHTLRPWHCIVLAALCLLPVLGWLGILDNASSDQINSSISSAGLIYGTARGINALVSLLQGTEINVIFLTVAAGEVLDPVNDLIERFSAMMLIALGSLALQKILLALVSHMTFNIFLTGLATCTGLALFQRNARVFDLLWKSFLIIAFLRFSPAIVVLGNGWVDAHFLDQADEQRHTAMMQFQGELREANAIATGENDYPARIAQLQDELTANAADLATTEQAIAALQQKIDTAANDLESLKTTSGYLCSISARSPSCPKQVTEALGALSQLEYSKQEATTRYRDIVEDVAEQRETLDCLQRKVRGQDCGLFDRLANAPNLAAFRENLDALDGSVGAFAENTIDLLMSILLKSLVIPLIFYYLLLKLARVNWANSL